MDLKRPEYPHIRTLLMKVRLAEIMTPKVICIRVDDLFSLVEEKMRLHNIRHLPVVDHENKLVGIVTQRDLYRLQSPRRDVDGNWFYNKESLDMHVLREVMTRKPMSLSPDDFAGTAILLMVDHKYGCIPIVNDMGKLCGIVTQLDILKILGNILREKPAGS